LGLLLENGLRKCHTTCTINYLCIRCICICVFRNHARLISRMSGSDHEILISHAKSWRRFAFADLVVLWMHSRCRGHATCIDDSMQHETDEGHSTHPGFVGHDRYLSRDRKVGR
jgi:hypothetical protein